jgi:hypothetical protein
MNEQPSFTADDAPSAEPRQASRGLWNRLRPILAFIQVRARFLVALIAIGLVVGQWERISATWQWATRQILGLSGEPSAVSSDTEFFCPMDPGVVSPWEDKCPICNMSLVRRKKGTAQALPKGVVARMQVSPYRLQLAGIQTAPVDFLPLMRDITAAGFVREAMGSDGSPTIDVEFRLAERDLPFVSPGDTAEVRLAHAESPPAKGELLAIDPTTDPRSASALARVRLNDAAAGWRPGSLATVHLRRSLAEVEPYRSLSREPPPVMPGELRTAYVSQSHPEVIRHEPGLCPFDKTALVPVPLAANQRLTWWCPMHPTVTASEDGHACQKCAGMKLLPRIVSYAPPGTVLTVPADAVIDTGRQQVVFVEVAPGMFEGVRVQLGSRTGDSFPVLAGLTAGQRVASAGAFLLDAETRLSSGAATAYFGAATSATGATGNKD